jgi:hypothetical protein
VRNGAAQIRRVAVRRRTEEPTIFATELRGIAEADLVRRFSRGDPAGHHQTTAFLKAKLPWML